MNATKDDAMDAVKILLEYLEGDCTREGLLDTPKRVVESWDEIFSGYNENPSEILASTFNGEGYDGIVLLKDIEFHSTCEHHLQPFSGKAHVAYIPNNKVVGLSKLARTVEIFSKRLQTQERLTMQIAKTLMNSLDAKGVAVTIDAAHQCMTMRGVKKEKATTVTNYFLGSFREDLGIQNRYLRYIKK